MLRAIITYLVVTVVTMTTVLQFHHHDCDGRVYINLTTSTDITLGGHQSLISKCNHDHRKPHKCNGEQNCAMHLGATDALRQHITGVCDCISCTLSALLCDIIDSVNAVTLVSCVIDTPYNAFAYKPIDRLGTPLRAPPIIYYNDNAAWL